MEHQFNRDVRIFCICNSGSMTLIISKFIESRIDVVGLCTRKVGWLSNKKRELSIYLKKNGIYPFKTFEYFGPADIIGSPCHIAKVQGIPVFYSNELDMSNFIARIDELNIDIILVSGFHRILKKELINLPKIGVYNIHPSILPYHRGGTPNRWVIRNGDNVTGVTVHKLTEDVDAGDIVISREIAVTNMMSWGELEEISARASVNLALEFVRRASVDKTFLDRCIKQDHSQATYESSYRGDNLNIDFSRSYIETCRQLRAILPKSGIFFCYGNVVLCLYEFEKYAVDENSMIHQKRAGRIAIENGCLLVRFSEWVMKINRCLLNGSPVAAGYITDKYGIKDGDIFYSPSLNGV